MKKTTISVVIPVFNEEKYLPQCLASLKKQTYQPLEIIVVDNNSTDKTGQIAKSFGARVIFEPNQGITWARQAGFKKAKGEIIARLDADSFAPPSWLNSIVEIFKKHPKIAAATGVPYYYDLPLILQPVINIVPQIWLRIGKLLMGHYQLFGPCCSIKADIVKKVKNINFDPKIHEDVALSCLVTPFGKILYSPKLNTLSSIRVLKRPLRKIIPYFLYEPIRTMLYYHPWFRRH